MEVIRQFSNRKLLAFIAATLGLQLSVFCIGLYLRWSSPEFDVSKTTNQQASLSSSFGGFASDISPRETFLSKSDFIESETANQAVEDLPEVQEDVVEEVNGVSIVTYKIQSGDTLTRVWQKHIGSSEGGIKAAGAFKEAEVSLGSLRVGSEVELQIDNNDITGFRMELANGDILVLDGNSVSGYSGSVIKPKVIEEDKVVSGQILNSFSMAAQRNEVPYAVVDQLVDIFGSRVAFRRDVQPGDTFTVMYKERRLETGRVLEPGPIRAASFENNGRWLAAVRHVDSDGEERYYDSEGKPIGSFFLRYPLSFTRISSVFNTSRFHPVLKRRRPHNGVDFAAPTGTPVRSVADGVISIAGYRGGAGNMVKIKHTSKYATAYLHLSRISKGIRNGVKVKRGQVIGAVGKSGLATGPHLHYSFYVNGKYVDPLKVELPEVPDEYEAIPASYLESVIETLKSSHRDLQVALEGDSSQPMG